ncbi:MAG TPA: cupin domain-containing protein [Burkholderiaceae bacterium]|jgi:cupin 2 domain-containing protein|nr:cupin domain-containing protein [Burkholderiaceae bacterium]
MTTQNLFRGIPPKLPDELIETLAASPHARIERIVSRGHRSPPGFWYDQDQAEWVLVVQGEAALRFERDQRIVRLGAGDHLVIPAHERHRVEWTRDGEDTIWLAVFY